MQAFYFKPNPNSAVFGYQKSPVGINTLNRILPDMLCVQAGLKRKTSHCLRVTCATRLFQHSVDEKLIRERTGHRSNALFNYERNSVEQERNVSKILGPPVVGENYDESNVKTEDGEGEDISGLGDLECEVSDEVLSQMPIPNVTETTCSQVKSNQTTLDSCVFKNCTINFVNNGKL